MSRERWCGIFIALALVMSFALALVPLGKAGAEELEWSALSIPSTEGNVILPGSDMGPLAVCDDGTLFAANGVMLLKSTDGGKTWEALDADSATAGRQDFPADIIGIAPVKGYADPGVVFVALENNEVYKSEDGGAIFSKIDAVTNQIKNPEEITSIAADADGNLIIGTLRDPNGEPVKLKISEAIALAAAGGNLTFDMNYYEDGTMNTVSLSIPDDIDGLVNGRIPAGVYEVKSDWITAGTWPSFVTNLDDATGITNVAGANAGIIDVIGEFTGVILGEYNIGTGTYYDGAENTLKYGGVYKLADTTIQDLELSLDVVAVAVAPTGDIVALGTDETDTILTVKVGAANWGATLSDAKIAGFVARYGMIAFPDDYATSKIVYISAANAAKAQGAVYRVNLMEAPTASTITDLSCGFVPCSIDASDGILVAGDANAAAVSKCTNPTVSLPSWIQAKKQPSGANDTWVVLAPDFAESGKVYVGTSGAESAFSVSTDHAVSFNQLSLIDTALDAMVDFDAVSTTTFLLLTRAAATGIESLWLTTDEGSSWQRILVSGQSIGGQAVQDLTGVEAVSESTILAIDATNDVIWKSDDDGATWLRLPMSMIPAGANISAVEAVDANTFFMGTDNGRIYKVTVLEAGAMDWTEAVITGNPRIHSIALSPNYAEDKTVLVGTGNGQVWISKDDGVTFEQVTAEQAADQLGITGNTLVAFSPNYATDNTIYAASEAAGEGIWRCVIDPEKDMNKQKWVQLLPVPAPAAGYEGVTALGSGITGIVIAADGTLYAASDNASGNEPGILRSLNPTAEIKTDDSGNRIAGPVFEWVAKGVVEDCNAALRGLMYLAGSNILYSMASDVDAATAGAQPGIVTYTDTLSGVKVELESPADGAAVEKTDSATLTWKAVTGATKYELQVATDEAFTQLVVDDANVTSTTYNVTNLSAGTHYYWRVRVVEPVKSLWSDTWGFATAIPAPFTADTMPAAIAAGRISPAPGATNVRVKPVFSWPAVEGATAYEIQIATDPTFAAGTFVVGDSEKGERITTTVWLCDTALDYDTTYFWRVRSVKVVSSPEIASVSEWSPTLYFVTEPAPPAPPAPKPAVPGWGIAAIIIGAVIAVSLIVVAARRRI